MKYYIFKKKTLDTSTIKSELNIDIIGIARNVDNIIIITDSELSQSDINKLEIFLKSIGKPYKYKEKKEKVKSFKELTSKEKHEEITEMLEST